MTSQSNGDSGGARRRAELVVVHVRDAINPALAGHDGVEYQSPPQPHARTRSRSCGCCSAAAKPPASETRSWSCPIAGGQRTVTLAPAPDGAEQAAAG